MGLIRKGKLMITLGELIDRSQIGRSEVARLCGVSYNTVYKWCKGLRRPKPEHLKSLSTILNVKITMLYKIIYGD
jgi:transcriptional regulator with XRE-family HTH domain